MAEHPVLAEYEWVRSRVVGVSPSSAVREFARRWPDLPTTVMVECRTHEENGAAWPTLLADPVRGFFRQMGGASEVAKTFKEEMT